MANPAPTINQINAFNATQGTTIDFNIIGGTELVRSNRIYIYDLSDNSLICTHLYVSTESIHELPANTDGSILYADGKSSADFVNGAQYYAQIQTFTDIAGTEGGSGLSVAKMFWCLVDPTLTIDAIPSTISTTSYNVSATYNANTSVVSNIIQQYQFNLYSATGSLLQSSGVIVGNGEQQGTSTTYDISYNFAGLSVGSSYYVVVEVTTTQGMSVSAQSNTFTVSIDTPTLGEATVVNNACDGYISVTSNLSSEYGGSASGEIVSFETDSENVFTKLKVAIEPTQSGSGTPSPSNVRPIYGVGGVEVDRVGKNLFDGILQNGYWDTSNGIFVANNGWKATYKIKCKPNTTYVMSGTSYSSGSYNGNVVFWDSNGTYLGYRGTGANFTSYPDAEYMALYLGVSYITDSMQIEEGSTATEYEPYTESTVFQEFNVSLTPTSKDTDPYLFKAVGDIYGDRLEEDIVGGTVAWNQLIPVGTDKSKTKNGVTFTDNRDGSYTIQTTAEGATADTYITIASETTNRGGHVTLLVGAPVGSTYAGYRLWDAWGGAGNEYGNGATGKFVVGGQFEIRISVGSGTIITTPVKFTPQLFDITQMFGSAIANYFYDTLRLTSGASKAWFRKFFSKPIYAYNAGELMSVNTSAHNTVGFNQLDPANTKVGGAYNPTVGAVVNLDSTGATYTGTNPIEINVTTVWYGCCLISEPLVAGQQYEVAFKTSAPNTANKRISQYLIDADNKVVTSPYNWVGNSGDNITRRFTPTEGGLRCAVTILSTSVQKIIVTDPCLHLVWDGERDGEYEAYDKHSYPLDSDLELRGIPKLDASNNLYYDGDVYESDGTVTRKYGIVDLGTLNWAYASDTTYPRFTAQLLGIKNGVTSVVSNIVCSKYKATYTNDIYSNGTDKSIGVNSTYLWIRDTAYTDAATFKTAMSGVMLVYELATPTTETADPFEEIQKVTPIYGTEEFVDNRTVPVPVGNNTQYLTRDVYGGYIDFVNGLLVLTHGIVDLGTLNYSPNGVVSGIYQYIAPVSGKAYGAINIISDVFVASEVSATNGTMRGRTSSTNVVFNTTIATKEDFKTEMNGHQLCYELAEPMIFQLTPQQIQTFVGKNNVWSEQGEISLAYHIPITNLLVKRQDVDDVSGDWLTLYSQPITQASDMDFTFIDFTNQYGKTYKYALVPLLTQTQSGVEVEVEGGYTVSDEVQSVFDGVFIVDSTGSQKCKANVGYGNVDMNQTVGTITPIGAKYPVVITNSKNQYHNGSISGTIVPDDYYFNGNLSRIDMVNKRDELEQFLTNKRAKIIKDWNGKIWLVMIMDNVSCTFNNNYGMGIVNFSTNWVEVGDPTNQQDLQETGLIDVGGV